MNTNVPDDWHSYHTVCDSCGRRFHLSEGGCGCYGAVKCSRCDELFHGTELDEYGECPDCAEWSEKHTCYDCGLEYEGDLIKIGESTDGIPWFVCPSCALDMASTHDGFGKTEERNRLLTYAYNEMVLRGLTCKN